MAGNADPSTSSVGERGAIDREEFVRLISHSLYSLGYRRAAAALESESGTPADPPLLDALLFELMSGRWDSCVNPIVSLCDAEIDKCAPALFALWKEHFLELVGSNELEAARDVLRYRIAPLAVDRKRVHSLARALVSGEGSIPRIDVVGRRIGLFLDLAEMLPSWVRVPRGRLEQLVETAIEEQVKACVYHNFPEEPSLYEDHACELDRIPSQCKQILHEHKNEVWFVQFSHDGRYLASSSSDCTVIIWMVEDNGTVHLKHCLEGHRRPISFISWSPNNKMLLSCGNGEDKIVCGSMEPTNKVFTCDLEGHELDAWEGERIPKIYDVVVTPDGNHIISICSNKEIWIQKLPKGKEIVIQEENQITSLSLSKDGMSLIVNLNSEEIHLWRLNPRSGLPAVYKGHRQGKFVIRSCFGGSNCMFIASGSEDSKVYIWQRRSRTPIKVLSGHLMTVNCVSWNPAMPHMLASASDDCTVRIWLAEKAPPDLHQR